MLLKVVNTITGMAIPNSVVIFVINASILTSILQVLSVNFIELSILEVISWFLEEMYDYSIFLLILQGLPLAHMFYSKEFSLYA